MKIEAVIFDLDGTIANTLPLCIAAFRKSIEPLLQASISDEEIIATFGPSEEGTIRKLIPTMKKLVLRLTCNIMPICMIPVRKLLMALKIY
jgi:beta-phosphoglucomutase-like phosphatase (HAD superfamily)